MSIIAVESVAESLRRLAHTRPDQTALTYADQSWTWAEVWQRVERAAAGLLSLGLRQGECFAFIDKNHPACFELLGAAACTGTAAAIMNSRLAPPELVYVLNDCRARVLFMGSELRSTVDHIRDQLVSLERIVVIGGDDDDDDPYERWLAGQTDGPAERGGDADATFIVLYTSGTTGFPKGAMLTHRGIAAHARAYASSIDLEGSSIVVSPLPQFHVGGSTLTWLTDVYCGAQTILVRELVPSALLDLLERERSTHALAVPTVLAGLVDVPEASDRNLSRLRSLAYGGSPIPLPLLNRVLATFPSAGLIQVYGMTEMSGVVSTLSAAEHRDAEHAERLTSAGRPLAGVEIKIVDPLTEQDLPPRQTGEVRIRSEQRMLGYWANRDASESAFSADGWLKSGDAGYVDEDGFLYIRDRIKDLIISGGENIYPAEVERVLAAHPNVAEVAVIGIPDHKWGESVKAVVVPRWGATVELEDLIGFARQHLAGYKCPKSMDLVAALPRNAMGKLLKRDLREPYWTGLQRRI
jgi:acyl-CoA synthetase (AMP-forming)/AMP-acid ligase II